MYSFKILQIKFLYMEALMLTQTENKRSVVITHFFAIYPRLFLTGTVII